MSFVDTKEMLKSAQAGGYAAGAFNVENLEMIQAVISAAEKENSPVIIQTTPGPRRLRERSALWRKNPPFPLLYISTTAIPLNLPQDAGTQAILPL